ncbi:hypothetical protein CLOM_g23027 [Closterium sp. NIES-68]|nr:hypothetical protein CLOM_g23027 [Closterium sp. NIES-68]
MDTRCAWIALFVLLVFEVAPSSSHFSDGISSSDLATNDRSFTHPVLAEAFFSDRRRLSSSLLRSPQQQHEHFEHTAVNTTNNCTSCTTGDDTSDTRMCASVHHLQRNTTSAARCDYVRQYCSSAGSKSLINYIDLHYCTLGARSWISLPLLLLGLLAAIFLLADTADRFFCPTVETMSAMLGLSPSTAGVTLLALGNGAPDVFSSLAAIVGGNPKVGLGAVVSAGAFVTCFVVGCVAVAAAPFSVRPRPFLRDSCLFACAVLLLLLVYLSGRVHLWQAAGLVAFYVCFVAVAIVSNAWEPPDAPHPHAHPHSHVHSRGNSPVKRFKSHPVLQQGDDEGDVPPHQHQHQHQQLLPLFRSSSPTAPHRSSSSPRPPPHVSLHAPRLWRQALRALTRSLDRLRACLHVLFDPLRLATIPSIDPSAWDVRYATANVFLCPLIAIYTIRAVLPSDSNLLFFLPPLDPPSSLSSASSSSSSSSSSSASLFSSSSSLSTSSLAVRSFVLIQSSLCAAAYLLATRASSPIGAPRSLIVPVSFAMSVFWIALVASELLGLLSALGIVLHVSPSILGITVLAWGNSVGDLVADVTIAKAGHPTMAIAGCFAGPMFNLMVGVGSALAVRSWDLYPEPLVLFHHPNVLLALCSLLGGVLSSIAVVVWSGFRVTRTWGVCLICMYLTFVVAAVAIESSLQ